MTYLLIACSILGFAAVMYLWYSIFFPEKF